MEREVVCVCWGGGGVESLLWLERQGGSHFEILRLVNMPWLFDSLSEVVNVYCCSYSVRQAVMEVLQWMDG